MQPSPAPIDRAAGPSRPGNSVLPLVAISLAAWAGFAGLFRAFWPRPSAPGDSLAPFWLWLVGGTLGFAVLTLAIFRLFRVPPPRQAEAVIALTSPALCCDIFTSTYFESWFSGGGPADDRRYAALVLGGVAILQLAVLARTTGGAGSIGGEAPVEPHRRKPLDPARRVEPSPICNGPNDE